MICEGTGRGHETSEPASSRCNPGHDPGWEPVFGANRAIRQGLRAKIRFSQNGSYSSRLLKLSELPAEQREKQPLRLSMSAIDMTIWILLDERGYLRRPKIQFQQPASGPIQTFASLRSTRRSKCLNHKDH